MFFNYPNLARTPPVSQENNHAFYLPKTLDFESKESPGESQTEREREREEAAGAEPN